MYAALWNRLPGPLWIRIVTVLVLVAVVVLTCFEVVFPLVARLLPINEQTVGSAGP